MFVRCKKGKRIICPISALLACQARDGAAPIKNGNARTYPPAFPHTERTPGAVALPAQQATTDPALDHLLQLPPHERVAVVKPLWRSLDEPRQMELLSLSLDELRDAAKNLAEAAQQHAGDAPRWCRVSCDVLRVK